MVLLDAGGERGLLAERGVVEGGERELWRSCWGSSEREGGKIRSRSELCMITLRAEETSTLSEDHTLTESVAFRLLLLIGNGHRVSEHPTS